MKSRREAILLTYKMSEFKKYAIVSFLQEEVEVVPSSWLVENSKVRWPSSSSLNTVRRFIRECKLPEMEWNTIPIRILGYSKSFKNANKKATSAQDTSDIGTDSSQSEWDNGLKPRKRVKPLRYDSSSEEDIKVEIESPAKKRCLTTNHSNLKAEPDFLLSPSTSRVADEIQESLSESSITSETPLPPTFQDDNTVALFTQVFKSLEEIKSELKSMKEDQSQIKYMLLDLLIKKEPIQGLVSLPEGITLPVETDDKLLQLNSSLKEKSNLKQSLARFLHDSASGKTVSSFLLCICRRVLHQRVAMQYSRLGRKGKKSFQAVEEVYNVILAAALLKYPDSKKEDMEDKLGRVLATATEWDGGRKNHKRTESANNSLNLTED